MLALVRFYPPQFARPVKAEGTHRFRSLRAPCPIKVVADVSGGGGFPEFIPKEIKKVGDHLARSLARRIERLPVQTEFSENCIMSSCVKPQIISENNPVVLVPSFESSCLEWSNTLPLLEETGTKVWVVDVLGLGFSNLERLPPCNAASKRDHLYDFWKSYIKMPMILVGPSLGAAVAIDFAYNYPEAVDKMILINPCVYAEGTGILAKLPKIVVYFLVSLLKSFPLRLYSTTLIFNDISLSKAIDWTNVSQKVLIICSEHDQIVSSQLATRMQNDLPNATMLKIQGYSHLPHVDKPNLVAKYIAAFARDDGFLASN